MCKGQQSTTTNNTSTSTPNPVALQAYNNLINQASNVVANNPYQPYYGQIAAPVKAETYTGIAGVNQYANAAQPGISQAEGLIGQSVPYINESGGLLGQSAGLYQNAAQPLTTSQINQYMNPYTQDVVNATEQQFNLQNAQQQNNLVGNAAAQGALGGNRVGVAQAQLAGQQQTAEAPVIAGLYNTAYQTGLGTAETEFQQNPEAAAAGLTNTASGLTNTAAGMNNAAYGLGSLAVSGQNAGLQGAGAQIQSGVLEQQTQQAQDTAAYNQWLQQRAYPFQQLNWESGIQTGVGSLMGGTNTGYGVTQGPTPSVAGPVAGLGIAALGAFAKDGGRIPEYDAGGAAPGVGTLPYGEGAALYGGVSGYVPSLQITHGSGPPKANPPTPQLPQQQQGGIFGGVDPKAIMSGYKGANNLFGNNWAGGPDESDDFSASYGDARGGRIQHLDTGGAPDDDAGLLPPSSGWGMGSFPSADGVLPPSTDQPIQVASLAPPSSDAGGVSPEHSTSPSMDEKRGVTVAMNGNAVPNGVLQDAAYLVKQGASSQDLQGFMSRNGYPMDGNWCGEFAASVVHAAGGQPPPGAAVATNWMKYGRPVPPQDVQQGDVAVLTRGHGVGQTGGHVGFVSEVDPQHGRFSLLGGNQGQAVKTEPIAGFQFRRGDYSDTPSGVASTNTVDPSGAGEAEARGLPHVAQNATPGVASDSGGFLGLHLSDAARQGLIAAGLGMSASGSPYPLQQIGQGGLQGLQAYGQAKTRDLAVQRLGIEADKARSEIAKNAAETGKYGVETESARMQLEARKAYLNRQKSPTPPPVFDPANIGTPVPLPTPPASTGNIPQPVPAPITRGPTAAPSPTQSTPTENPASSIVPQNAVGHEREYAAWLDQQALAKDQEAQDAHMNGFPDDGIKAQAQSFRDNAKQVREGIEKGAEKRYDVAVQSGQKLSDSLTTQGESADKQRQDLALQKKIVNDPGLLHAGPGRPVQETVTRAAIALHMANPERVTADDLFDKLRAGGQLDQIQGLRGLGAIRKGEIDFIDKMIASRDASAEALRTLVEIEDRVAARSQKLRDLANNYGGDYLDKGFHRQLAQYFQDPKNALISDEELADPRKIAPPVFKARNKDELLLAIKKSGLPSHYPIRIEGSSDIGYTP